jgi:hypothetical protein
VKAQSIRRVQGPVQRSLRLATVHVDVAGKRVGARFKDRGVEEADRLVEELASLSRGARRQVPIVAPATGTPVTGTPATGTPATGDAVTGMRVAGNAVGGAPVITTAPGWFADPARRHQARYWDGTDWTEQISDNGVTGADPL